MYGSVLLYIYFDDQTDPINVRTASDIAPTLAVGSLFAESLAVRINRNVVTRFLGFMDPFFRTARAACEIVGKNVESIEDGEDLKAELEEELDN